jgi:ABC-2 type transport system permease protein
MSAVLALARAEMLRLLRNRVTLSLLVIVPVLQMLLFGLAIDPTGARLPVAIAGAPSPAHDAARAALGEVDGLRLVGDGSAGSARAAVAAGTASIGIELADTPGAAPQIIVDGSNPALTASAEAALTARYWQAIAGQSILGAAAEPPRLVRLGNRHARANWPFLAGLIGVTVMIGMVMLGSLSLAREREGGQWETLRTLPFGPVTIIAGKLLPWTILGSLQGALVLAAAVTLFALPAPPATIALLALLPLFAATHLLIGFAIAARARTQLAALQGAVAFYLPAMLLSGFLYPVETLPAWAARLGGVFPLTAMVAAARGALLQGRPASAVLLAGLPMLAVAIVAAAVAWQALRHERG